MLWQQGIDVTITSYSNSHIDALVKGDSEFRLTLFYGNPRTKLRKESWYLLRNLSKDLSESWVVLGDFNEIMFSTEMRGERVRPSYQMRNFREVLQECALSDLGWERTPFTFTNKRKGSHETKARLDRVVVTKKWREDYPEAKVIHGFANASDHNPIILKLKGLGNRQRKERNPIFKFEPMWLRDTNFRHTMAEAWSSLDRR